MLRPLHPPTTSSTAREISLRSNQLEHEVRTLVPVVSSRSVSAITGLVFGAWGRGSFPFGALFVLLRVGTVWQVEANTKTLPGSGQRCAVAEYVFMCLQVR